MEFKEIYCNNCKKIIGRYNIKFYNDEKIGKILNTQHISHIRNGHHVTTRKIFHKTK